MEAEVHVEALQALVAMQLAPLAAGEAPPKEQQWQSGLDEESQA